MQAEYSYTDLGGGAELTLITDPKFKSNMINVRFLTFFDPKWAPAYALIPQLIVSTNRLCPDSAMMNRRLNSLYGAWTGAYTNHRGGVFELSVSLNCLRDRFVLGGEKVFEEAAQLLADCIFDPFVENGGFAEAEFSAKKLSLLNLIDGEINDKPYYATLKALEIAYRGETCAQRHFVSREAVEKLTAAEAYEAYKHLLSTAKFDITICGGGEFEGACEIFKEAFKTGRSRWDNPVYYSPSPAKPEPEYGELRLDVQQANLIMIYKTCGADSAAMEVLSSLYGETPVSKLFLNVRERLSLCYGCSSVFGPAKDVLIVDSGVAPENVGVAKNEIIRQLDLITEGDFSNEELSAAKLAIENNCRGIGDRIGRLDEWYHACRLKGISETPEQHIQKLWNVSREDVVAAARALKLDTVFVLTDKGV